MLSEVSDLNIAKILFLIINLIKALHCLEVARFAGACIKCVKDVTKQLEVTLGPDTADIVSIILQYKMMNQCWCLTFNLCKCSPLELVSILVLSLLEF